MFDKKCPHCGEGMVTYHRYDSKGKLVEKELYCDRCEYSEPYETVAEKIDRMNRAGALLQESPMQGVTVVEQAAKEFVLQKEKDITTAIIKSCVAVGVDPEALVKTSQLNATLKDKLYEVIERFSWVPCSERMPLKDGDYLLLIKSKMTGYRYRTISNYYTGRSFFTGPDFVATHWMELPELPKESSDDEYNE